MHLTGGEGGLREKENYQPKVQTDAEGLSTPNVRSGKYKLVKWEVKMWRESPTKGH